jgi:hypothetical protein
MPVSPIPPLRESERLLEDSEAQAGEAVLAEHAMQYKSSAARGIHRASSGIAAGLVAGAEYAKGGIEYTAAYLMPSEPTHQPVQVSEATKRRWEEGLQMLE